MLLVIYQGPLSHGQKKLWLRHIVPRYLVRVRVFMMTINNKNERNMALFTEKSAIGYFILLRGSYRGILVRNA